MIGLLYFIVIIFANTIGAISGMGGGVIIKPLLDTLGFHSVVDISLYSSVAVFIMSIVSTYRQMRNGIQLKIERILPLAISSILGGMLGNKLFDYFVVTYGEKTVQLIQIALTIVTLLFALWYSKFKPKQYTLTPLYWWIVCGLTLGTLASLLGIGGGPINVALLMLMFALPIKEATVYSVATIFFSQLSKLTTIALSTGFGKYDLSMLLFIIPAAFCGGLLGAKYSRVLSEEKVTLLFQLVIIGVIAINIYNGINRLF